MHIPSESYVLAQILSFHRSGNRKQNKLFPTKKRKRKKTKKKQNNEGKLQRGAAQLPSNKAQWQDCTLSLSPYLSLCFITLSFC